MWTTDIETDIFSIIKSKVVSALSTDYPNIYFTMDDSVQTEPKFPTVYLDFISSTEQATDLVGTDIPAILLTVQFEVTVTKAQGIRSARLVSDKVLGEFKKLRFETVSLPRLLNTNPDTKRIVGRCRRMIASGDTWN